MARINLEDSLFEDPRFEGLCIKIGFNTAIGSLIKIWRMSQKYIMDDCIIPEEVYDSMTFPVELVELKWVIKDEKGYYPRGASKNFNWLKQRINNGKNSGKKNLETHNKTRKKSTSETTSTPLANKKKSTSKLLASREQAASEPLASHQRTTSEPLASSSLLLSSSSSPLLFYSDSLRAESPPEGAGSDASTPGQELVASWVEIWKSRYGSRPPITGRDAGQLKSLAKDLGVQRLKDLLGAYIGMNDSHFLKRRHDMMTFRENLNGVAAKLDSGIMISHKNAVMAEDMEAPPVSKMKIAMEQQEAMIRKLREKENGTNAGQLDAPGSNSKIK